MSYDLMAKMAQGINIWVSSERAADEVLCAVQFFCLQFPCM